MATLTICRGLSGSGKSTWARNQNAVVVSRDDLRVALYGSDGPDYYRHPDLSAREDFITKVEHDAVRRALTAGQDCISDNTNIEMRFVNALAKVGYSVGAQVEVKTFLTDVETAIARNKIRAAAGGRDVPEAAIRRQHQRFKPGAKVVEAPVLKQYTGTPYKPDAFLFDLDGTTYHMGDKRGPYDHNVDVDDPDIIVQDIVNSLAENYVAIAMSGRVEATRAKTIESLNRDDVWFDALFMRKDGDMRSDNIIKHELFWEHVAPNYNVKFVLDDRDQVVSMWRSIGIKTLQVADGEF